MLCLDWNTLIVGKLSPWIDADSEIETERRNSEAVSSSLWTYTLIEAVVDVAAGDSSLSSCHALIILLTVFLSRL